MPKNNIASRYAKEPSEEGEGFHAVTISFDDTEHPQYEHFRSLDRAPIVLGDDIMTEVLSRLPAKTMIRLMACNKNMAQLIGHPFTHALYINRVNKGFALLNLKAPLFDVIPLDEAFGLPAVVQTFMKKDVREKLECQDGLIVYWSTSGDLRIINPLTKKFSVISTPPGLRHGGNKKLSVFLRAINGEDYEIISVISDYKIGEAPKKLALEVWRYSTHQWEFIAKFDSNSFDISIQDAVLTNGLLYWLTFCEERKLICFNLNTKILQYVPLPDNVGSELSISTQVAISPWPNESLALIENKKNGGTMDIWVRMKSHWLNVQHIKLPIGDKKARFHALFFDKAIIFSIQKKIYKFTFEGLTLEELGQFRGAELNVVKKYVATFLSTGNEEQYFC